MPVVVTESEKICLAVWFAVADDLKYLSHRDTIRLWQRILTRARVPVCYSQGFNPRQRISLPLPRSVAMTARMELLLVYLQRRCRLDELLTSLRRELPLPLRIHTAGYVSPGVPAQPRWAEYVVTLTSQPDRAELGRTVELFLRASTWPVNRPARGRHPQRTLDLRPCVKELKLGPDELLCIVNIDPAGTARIDELLEALHLNTPGMIREICRSNVGYPPEFDPEKMKPIPSENNN